MFALGVPAGMSIVCVQRVMCEICTQFTELNVRLMRQMRMRQVIGRCWLFPGTRQARVIYTVYHYDFFK